MAESQGPTVTTVSVIFGVITIITISLRLFARIHITNSFGPDDALIIIGALLAWAFIVATILAVNHGLGSHMDDVMLRGTDNLISYSQIVWLSSIFYNACLGFIKTSVLALYTRLGDRELRRLAYIMIGVVSCQAGANVIVCIFECSPVQAAYDLTITDMKCININAFYLANAAVNISTDVLTYAIPLKMVSKLQMPRRQKVGLGIMMSLGFVACLSSIIRITYIPQMLEVGADATWVISGAMYWSAIETNVGILAASIPSFKAIAKRYAPALLGSSNRGGSEYKLGGSKSAGRSLSTNKLSRFQLMDKSRSGRQEVDIQAGGHDDDDGFGGAGAGGGTSSTSSSGPQLVDSRFKPGQSTYNASENSSEEEIYLKRQPPPKGKIGVRTDINTFYENA
ncbi:hypothetical protein Daus18300_010103 [Diaporthe australafricana]|uniref:Rhodopsin domain-containing protein n=1 Tax=Diaporthe australafricana TaxID=127596 RepID=A0ABR3WBX3_9PEZI